jgi:flagellar motility protein MotE (MotC chaperone)
MKYLTIIACCVCVTIVLSEATAALVLWQRGFLSASRFRDMRRVLIHGASIATDVAEGTASAAVPTLEEIADARALTVFNLDKRESELMSLKSIADKARADLEAGQALYRAHRKEFEDELRRLEEAVTAAATEQARGVLLALPPKEAVKQLMQLPVEDNVKLLKGMSEKTIAKILKEFSAESAAPRGTAPSAEAPESPAERGKKIFEALSRGEPTASLIRQAQQDFATAPAQPNN